MRWPVVTYSRLIAESEACTACDLRHKRLLKRPENCRIKGNINAKGERIYHVLGQTDEESLDQLQSTYIAALLKIGETVRGLRVYSTMEAVGTPRPDQHPRLEPCGYTSSVINVGSGCAPW